MDPVVAAIGLVEFLIILAVSLMLTKRWTRDKDLPKIAVLSAGIFVAQMVNFPVGGGTTGHLIGGALFAILAGPAVAVVGMSAVILIQALMFGDGGISALGLNGLNMAVIAPLSGWGVYNLVRPMTRGFGRSGDGIAVGVAAWSSVFLAAATCAAELAVSFAVSSGTYGIAANISVPAMLGYHAVIGIGEAAITCGVVAYLASVSHGLFERRATSIAHRSRFMNTFSSRTVQATIAVLVVFAASLPFYFLYASEGRDGLEQTIAASGATEADPYLRAPFSYGETYLAALLAGIVGFLVVALCVLGLMKLIESTRTKG